MQGGPALGGSMCTHQHRQILYAFEWFEVLDFKVLNLRPKKKTKKMALVLDIRGV